MAYVQLTYYRDCALELREYGNAGWAVHIYAPRLTPRAVKIGVLMTTQAGELRRLMADARGAVDAQLGPVASPRIYRNTMPSPAYPADQLTSS
jgi:hypothetical protein